MIVQVHFPFGSPHGTLGMSFDRVPCVGEAIVYEGATHGIEIVAWKVVDTASETAATLPHVYVTRPSKGTPG